MTLLAFPLSVLLLPLAAPALPQSPLAPNAPVDMPVSVKDDEQHKKLRKAIAPLVETARKTWPAAKARYLKGLPSGHIFFITAELVDMANKREIVFVEVVKIEKGRVFGVIANQINVVMGYHQGQQHSVAEDGIMDWTISKPDGSEEGNVVGKFLDTYKPE